MVMVVVMMVGVHYNYNLRLCRKRCCETEDENQPKEKPFHSSWWRFGPFPSELL